MQNYAVSDYAHYRNDNIARNNEFLKNLHLGPSHTVTGGDSSMFS